MGCGSSKSQNVDQPTSNAPIRGAKYYENESETQRDTFPSVPVDPSTTSLYSQAPHSSMVSSDTSGFPYHKIVPRSLSDDEADAIVDELGLDWVNYLGGRIQA